MLLQGRLISLFTSDAQVIAQATAILPVIAFVMVSYASSGVMPLVRSELLAVKSTADDCVGLAALCHVLSARNVSFLHHG